MADYGQALQGLAATLLPISNVHALVAGSFDQAHRDPFDRILAAQARVERLPFATQDPAFAAFDLQLIW